MYPFVLKTGQKALRRHVLFSFLALTISCWMIGSGILLMHGQIWDIVAVAYRKDSALRLEGDESARFED